MGPILCESEKSFGYFWKTALFLHEKMQALRGRMEWLKKQEEVQREFRSKFESLSRGPTLPMEIIGMILACIPTENELPLETKTEAGIDGLLPLAVLNPSLLSGHFVEPFDSEWTLEEISKKKVKSTVLEDESLKECMRMRLGTSSEDPLALRSLTVFPHQWRSFVIRSDHFSSSDFIDLFEPCFPLLEIEEFGVYTETVSSHDPVDILPMPVDNANTNLKKVYLSFNMLSGIFNTGFLNINSITDLVLYRVGPKHFTNKDAYKKTLCDLPLIVSQLPRLTRLGVFDMHRDPHVLEDCPKFRSASLRSLHVERDIYAGDDPVVPFFTLFADCHIDCITLRAQLLRGLRELPWRIRRINVEVTSWNHNIEVTHE